MTKENIKDIYIGQTLLAGDLNEVVTVHLIDEDNGKVYCSDETFGISMWYDMEVLQKIDDEPEQVVLDDEFLTFAKALEAVAKFNGIDVPQIEVEEEPDVVDDYDYDDLTDDYDDLFGKYDGYRKFEMNLTFSEALDYLKFEEENKEDNTIWYITNGERTLTFKDERLVDVRLSEHIENFVYFAAPIQLKDLRDEWELKKIDDEETQKINEIIELIQLLHNDEMVQDLLYTIKKYRE